MTPIFPRPSPLRHPLKAILWVLFLSILGGVILSYFDVRLYPHLAVSTSSFPNIWTFLTYPFAALPLPTFTILFHLAFDLFLLFAFGAPIIERIGQKRFLVLFFGATLLGGLFAFLGLRLWPRPSIFAGPSPALFALITSWTILNAERTAHLASFALRPLWIFLLLVGLNLVLNAIGENWTYLAANASGVFFGYAFCLISEHTRSCIPFLYPIERTILRAINKMHSHSSVKTPKIIDFRTGQAVLDDDQFMDEMLAKISQHGKGALNLEEQKRMQQISTRKASKN